jgi:heme/copper-type cytochrome/quinol oxidase subunit 3
MVLPPLTLLALFLTPFVLYAVYLRARRGSVMHASAWSLNKLARLTITALLLVSGALLAMAQLTGSRPGSAYVPAHIEDGKVVPGAAK